MPLAGSSPRARVSAPAEATTFAPLVAGRWCGQEGAFSKNLGLMTVPVQTLTPPEGLGDTSC